MAMFLIILAGLLSVVYGVVTAAAMMKADAGRYMNLVSITGKAMQR